MNEKENSLRTIFVEAVEISDALERDAFLQRACGDDLALREKLERLIRAHADVERSAETETLATSNSPISEKPGDKIGHYKLREKIGEGGCGVVYVAEQEEPVRRRVALKVIKLGMDTKQVVARFEAERQALALMDHPNIARVLDAGATDTGRPYFVMELVRGIKITDYCDQNSFSTEQRLDLFIQVCHAVQHAHQKGIIHRDLKPSNILVTPLDGRPVPKVIDFGIAKATEGRLSDLTVYTELHQFIGTPAYMSPEQAGMSGLDIDTRSDIYSLGVLLYELLTGRTPFDAKALVKAGLDEMRRIVREQEPVKPSTRLSTLAQADLTEVARRRQVEAPKLIHVVRGDLDWIAMKCLEKDRARRYETANGLAMDLQRHLQDEPVVARPPASLYRFQKLVRRNKRTFAAVGAVAAALISGLGVSTWLFIRERMASKAADENALLAGQHARRAEASSTESRERLVRLNVGNGVKLLDDGDHFNALLWFAEAFKLEESLPDRAANHRLRLAATLRMSPRLVHLWLTGQPETRAGFSRDGRLVLSVSQNGITCAWDATSGAPITSPLPLDRPGALVDWLARFHPDGRQVLAVETNQVSLREVSNGRETLRFPHPQVRGACFNANGDRVFTWSMAGQVLSWNPTTGQLSAAAAEHGGRIARFTVSRDGRRFLTVATNAECQVWDTSTGQRSGKPFIPSKFPFLTHVGFNLEGSRIVSADDYGSARVWDAATGEPVTPPIQTSSFLFHAVFSPDGERLVTSGLDRLPKIWNARSGGLLLNLVGHKDSSSVATFSPDGKRVATGNKDQTVRVWDVETGKLVSPILSHSAFVQTVEFHPDGNQLLTACDDGTVRLWDLGTSDLTFRPWNTDQPRIISLTDDGRRLLTQDDGKRVQVWDGSTRQAIGFPLAESNAVFLAALGPDEKRLLAVSGQPNSSEWALNLWDVTSGKLLTSAAASAGMLCVAWVGPEQACVAILRTNVVEVRKLTASGGVTPPALLLPHATKEVRETDEPLHAAFSPDGKMLVTLNEKEARVWDLTNGQQRFGPLRHAFPVYFAQFSPDNRLLVTTCSDAYLAARPAQVWDAQTGRPIGPPLPHNDGILFARFSPEGTSLLTCSEDGTARLWHPLTGAPLAPPLRHNHYVNWAIYSHDVRRVLTGCVDGTARLWDAHTGEPLTPFFPHRGGPVEAGGLLADGQVLLTRSGSDWFFWQLPNDLRSAEGWRATAQLLAGHQLDATGTLEPVAATSLSNLWTRLRSEYPEDFRPR